MLPLVVGIPVGVFFVCSKASSHTYGIMEISGNEDGNFTFVPKACRFQDASSSKGAVLVGDDQEDGEILVLKDGMGKGIVKIRKPSRSTDGAGGGYEWMTISSSQCKVFELSMEECGWEKPASLKGSLKLDCILSENITVHGEMDFEGCV